jgi:hypothetical protein
MASFAVSEVIAPGRHEGIVLVLREILGGFAASMLGGWTASWIARGGVLSGGTALAGFCLMMAIVSLDLSGGLAHHLMLVTVMVSGVLAGCLVRARQSRPAQ